MKGNAEVFRECLHFPRIERKNFETRVHFIDEIFDEQFHLLMDSDKVGDYHSYGFSLDKISEVQFSNLPLYSMSYYKSSARSI